MSSNKSLKFEIDKTLLEKSLTRDPREAKKRIEGQTVILKRVSGAKPPPQKLGIDVSRGKKKSRRQLAEEMAKRQGVKKKVVLPPAVRVFPRLMALALDFMLFLILAWLLLGPFQESIISGHAQFMHSLGLSFMPYSTELYFLRVLLPAYFVAFYLPCFIFRSSFGKYLMAIRISSNYDTNANFGQLILRELIRPISVLSVVGIVIAAFRPYRGLHDYIAGTKPVVIQR